MPEILTKLAGSKWGVVGLLAGGAVAVGAGVVAHDSPGAQAAALAAAGLCATGLGALVGFVAGKFGGPPPAPPAAVAA